MNGNLDRNVFHALIDSEANFKVLTMNGLPILVPPAVALLEWQL